MCGVNSGCDNPPEERLAMLVAKALHAIVPGAGEPYRIGIDSFRLRF
jgi:hypothetical protein